MRNTTDHRRWCAGARAPQQTIDKAESALHEIWTDDASATAESIHEDSACPLELSGWDLEYGGSTIYTGTLYLGDLSAMAVRLETDRAPGDALLLATRNFEAALRRFAVVEAKLRELAEEISAQQEPMPQRYWATVRPPNGPRAVWRAEDFVCPELAQAHLTLTGLSDWLQPIEEADLISAQQAMDTLVDALALVGPPDPQPLGYEVSVVFKRHYGMRDQGTFEIEEPDAHEVSVVLLEEAISHWLRVLTTQFTESMNAEYEYRTSFAERLNNGDYEVIDEDGDEVPCPEPSDPGYRHWQRKQRQHRARLAQQARDQEAREARRAQDEARRAAERAARVVQALTPPAPPAQAAPNA